MSNTQSSAASTHACSSTHALTIGRQYHPPASLCSSCTLVLQTVFPILLFAGRVAPSTVIIAGGTHNAMCPPVTFLEDTFAPLLARAGLRLEIKLLRHGFFPAGGGSIRATISPLSACSPAPLRLLERGKLLKRTGTAMVANMSQAVAERQAEQVRKDLGWTSAEAKHARIRDATGPGNVVLLQAAFEQVTETCTGFSERRDKPEDVAKRVCVEMERYLAADAPVGEHLADQLLLPLVLSGAGGEFRAIEASLHFVTNVATIGKFLGDGLIEYRSAAAAAARGSSTDAAAADASASATAASGAIGGAGAAAGGAGAAAAPAPLEAIAGEITVTVRGWKRP